MTEAKTPAVKTPVTLTDGRVVEFASKQKLVKNSSISEDGQVTITLDFVNGETRNFTIPSALLLRFAAHGAEQKLGDAIAGESDIGDAVLSVDDLITRLTAGEWTVRRASGEFAGTSVLLKALVEASGMSVEAMKTFLASKTPAQKLALRKTDKIRPIIERLEAEKVKKSKVTVDTDSLLDELGLGAPAKKGKTSEA